MRRYLFVIDYQHDFVDGAPGFPGEERLDKKNRRQDPRRRKRNGEIEKQEKA